MIRRFTVATALVAGLTLSLTGCFGESGEAVDQVEENVQLTAVKVLDKVAENTGQAGTFYAEFAMSVSAPTGKLESSGTMQYRLEPEMAFSMTFEERSVGGRSMNGAQQILIGRTLYMKTPQISQLPGSSPTKPWVKISLDGAGAKSGLNVERLLQQTRQLDPVQHARFVAASKDVRELGQEKVNGVETTHYAGTYLMEDAVERLPADQRGRARANLARVGYDSVKFDLWVDGEQMPRQLTLSTPSNATGQMNMTITYHDYGKPVDITAPPANQVTDLETLIGGS